eukprot:TRINITY_DN36861_c0_g1_i2.p1 TRINITY_DN36861_c0_g1~~TRINITY_DN36861_c0_g1_i2.p1  ORF type:complete len:424 (-),score=66.10 TRINITY_DN36861_c0_g1_i2:44-1315(-)
MHRRGSSCSTCRGTREGRFSEASGRRRLRRGWQVLPSYVEALRNVQECRCTKCGMCFRPTTTASEQADGCAVHLDACRRQEEAAFLQPWRGAFGRDPRAAGEASVSLLAPSHWLFVDSASHEVENAPLLFRKRGMASPEAMKAGLATAMSSLSAQVRCVRIALARFLRLLPKLFTNPGVLPASEEGSADEDILATVSLPELLLTEALCTGKPEDFQRCLDEHRSVYSNRPGAASLLRAMEELCTSPETFLKSQLQLHLQNVQDNEQDAGPGGQASLPTLLDAEHRRAARWLGHEGADGAQEVIWILRRMWLCPNFEAAGAEEDDDNVDGCTCTSNAKEDTKKATKAQASRKRPAAAARRATPDRKRQSMGKPRKITAVVRKKPAARAPSMAKRARHTAGTDKAKRPRANPTVGSVAKRPARRA